nr:hypothetical protein [Tanacetum cinerariifolium]
GPFPEFLQTVTHLSKLRCSLSTFFSKVYVKNDKFKEPAYLGWDRSRLLVLYILGIHNHFLELEESFQDKTPYPAPATKSLSFKKLADENEDLLLWWSADNFRDAVDLLSSNLNKWGDYESFLVSVFLSAVYISY